MALLGATTLVPPDGPGEASAHEHLYARYFTDDPKVAEQCRGLTNTFKCARSIERYRLSRGARGITRDGIRLRIGLAAGRRIELRDESRNDELTLAHSYIEYLASINFHVVHLQYYEGAEYLLISHLDGARYVLPERPRVSPDGSLIAAAAGADAYGLSGVFVYRVSRGLLRPEIWHVPEEHARYEFARWEGNAIVVRRTTNAPEGRCPGFGTETIDVLVIERADGWRFDPRTDSSTIACQ